MYVDIFVMALKFRVQRHSKHENNDAPTSSTISCDAYRRFTGCVRTYLHPLERRAPSNLASIVQDAGPLFYSTVFYLGSYPYHLNPEDRLTADVLRNAVILILSKYRFRGWNGERDRKFVCWVLGEENKKTHVSEYDAGSLSNRKRSKSEKR
jgi:hypothetical protein